MSLNAQKTREFSPNVLRRIKLRTRLFVTFLIISLVPVITIGIFSYHAYTQSMNEKVKQADLPRAQRMAGIQNDALRERSRSRIFRLVDETPHRILLPRSR